MATINVQIAVDAATLAQQVLDKSLAAGTQSNPTSLGSWDSSNVYLTMTTQNNSVDNNSQGQSELNVKATSGDTIEWVITTFGNNVDYTPYLYNGSFSPNTAITPLNYVCPQVANYFPPSGTPSGSLTEYVNQAAFAAGTVIQLGKTIQYTLSFALVDNTNGNTIGCFYWDPFITVNS